MTSRIDPRLGGSSVEKEPRSGTPEKTSRTSLVGVYKAESRMASIQDDDERMLMQIGYRQVRLCIRAALPRPLNPFGLFLLFSFSQNALDQ